METRTPTQIALIMNTKEVIMTMIPLILIAWYVTGAVQLQTWTPGLGLFLATPDGYQSVRAFRAARTHDFPAVHEQPPPSPVAGTGHILAIKDGTLYGTQAPPGRRPEVKTLRMVRVFGPALVAHLDVPLRPGLQEQPPEPAEGRYRHGRRHRARRQRAQHLHLPGTPGERPRRNTRNGSAVTPAAKEPQRMPDQAHDTEIQNLLRALPVPDALYPCSGAGCREEHTWPAEDLAWFSGRDEGADGDDLTVHAVEAGWYCPQCCKQLDIECDGPPLPDTLAAHSSPGEPMPEDGRLIHTLNMAGDEPAHRAAALYEAARRMLAYIAGCELLPPYNPDRPLEGEAAVFPGTEIARREIENPFALRTVALSPQLATRIAIELQDMSLILQKAGQKAGPERRVQ